MSVQRRNIAPIVILVAAALVGLMVLQGYLLNNAYALKEQAFERNVRTALGAASQRLESGVVVTQLLGEPGRLPAMRGGKSVSTTVAVGPRSPDSGGAAAGSSVSLALPGGRPDFRVEGNSFYYRVATPQRVRLRLQDAAGHDSLVVDSVQLPGNHVFTLTGHPPPGGHSIYRYSTDSMSLVVSVNGGASPTIARGPANERERALVVSRVVDNLWTAEADPPERRFPAPVLDSILHASMAEAGIPIDFAYGIAGAPRDSIRLARPESAAPLLRLSALRAPLFLLEPFGRRSELVVAFPGRSAYILNQLWPAFLASLVFIAVLAFAFVSTLRVLTRQQKLAVLMVDFINNMTHEFKTPISTVALASEAIRRGDVVGKKAKVLRYNRIIAEEASRMKGQVDRILQMAQLEEGDVEMRAGSVDMHAVIAAAAGTFALQVDARGGTLTTDLRAAAHVIEGDAAHCASIIHNLLDNANKYSPGAPAIGIATENDGGALVIRVRDAGIGIPAEHQKSVFEKY